MAFRNLSSSESQSSSKLPVISKQVRTCFFSAGLTQQHVQREKRSCRPVLLCMKIRIGILVNVRFYCGAISNEQ